MIYLLGEGQGSRSHVSTLDSFEIHEGWRFPKGESDNNSLVNCLVPFPHVVVQSDIVQFPYTHLICGRARFYKDFKIIRCYYLKYYYHHNF